MIIIVNLIYSLNSNLNSHLNRMTPILIMGSRHFYVGSKSYDSNSCTAPSSDEAC